jgi:division/cell wall cluster transcriptional repressor MraZ
MPPKADTAEQVLYLGKHSRGVDSSRRVLLPSDWRGEGSPTEFTILLWPARTRDYLLVLPPKRWAEVLERLGNQSLMSESAAAVERFISANSCRKSLDSYGRLPLPDDAAKVGINGEAMLVGRMNKFEIWSPARFETNSESLEAQKVFDTLSAMHL